MGSAVLVAITLLLTAPPDIEKAKTVLPEHAVVDCATCEGGKQVTFQFPEYKLLLGVGFELHSLRLEKNLLLLKIGHLEAQVSGLEEEIDAWEGKSETWETEAFRLRGKWENENRLRHKAEIAALSVWPWVHVALGAAVGSGGALWGALDTENPAPWVLLGTGVLQLSIGLLDAIL
jgi:hypothetical protein